MQFEFNLKELHDEVLEIFFAGNTKENCKSLKPVSVHDRNKGWINKYRGSFLLKVTVNNTYSITVHFDKLIED